MFFHKASQQAFVFPPKCGTFTTITFLRFCGWDTLGTSHAFTEEFINKYPNLKNCRIYSWFRDPVKRFESSILHVKQKAHYRPILEQVLLEQNIHETFQTVTYEQLVDIFPIISERCDTVFAPQSKWYTSPNVEPLNFDNMEAELRRITGNFESPFEKSNVSTEFGRSVITQKVIDFVRSHYAEDYALAKDRLSSEVI